MDRRLFGVTIFQIKSDVVKNLTGKASEGERYPGEYRTIYRRTAVPVTFLGGCASFESRLDLSFVNALRLLRFGRIQAVWRCTQLPNKTAKNKTNVRIFKCKKIQAKKAETVFKSTRCNPNVIVFVDNNSVRWKCVTGKLFRICFA